MKQRHRGGIVGKKGSSALQCGADNEGLAECESGARGNRVPHGAPMSQPRGEMWATTHPHVCA